MRYSGDQFCAAASDRVPPVSGASSVAAYPAPTVATAARTAAITRRSARATAATAAKSAAAAIPISWSVPNSGMRKNEVASVPKMLPAVEMEKRRPAVRPTRVSDWARRRTAIGVTPAMRTLGRPKSAIAAISGFSRGPGSQDTTASSTGSSMIGMRRIVSAARAMTPSRSPVAGSRSASAPPSQ